MASNEFPYKKYGGAYFPTVPVKLSRLGKEIDIGGLIDSGASYCVFHAELGEALGLPIGRSAPTYVDTVSEKVAVHMHKIRLQVLGEPFECEAAFVKNMGTSFNLLGRVGFFERHGITFKENEKKVVLDENE